MAARDVHLRRIHAHEAIYGGTKPEPWPFITDRDVIDAQHKFLRDNDNEEADPIVKEYYESLIKDCVLVDLSRYREKKVFKASLRRPTLGGDAMEDYRRGKSWERRQSLRECCM
jgi:hypothetical protein